MFGIKTKIKKYLQRRFVGCNTLESIRIFPVGYSCNHACPMCWRAMLSSEEKQKTQSEERNRLSLATYKQVFQNMPKSVKTIEIVGGGEPLLFPHIDELFMEVKKNNRVGRLITNGSLMSESLIDTVIRCSWDFIRISFHAGSKKVHQKVVGAGDYEVIINNIKQLIQKRGARLYPQVSLLFVIQKENINDIAKFASLAETLRVDEVEFSVLTPTCDPKVLLTNQQRKKAISSLRALKNTLHIHNNIELALHLFTEHPIWRGVKNQRYYEKKYCSVVQSGVDIAADGRVVPCCMAHGEYEYGNVRNTSLGQIWKKGKVFRKRLFKGKFYPFCYSSCSFELAERR